MKKFQVFDANLMKIYMKQLRGSIQLHARGLATKLEKKKLKSAAYTSLKTL